MLPTGSSPPIALPGARLREKRKAAGLSQAAMASQLGISASYLSLLEAGHRAIPTDLRAKIVALLGLPSDELNAPDDRGVAAELEATMRSPAMASLDISRTELAEVVLRHPSVARALVTLNRSLLGATATVNALTERLANESDSSALGRVRIPSEEISDLIQRHNNYFPVLEEAAETLWDDGGLRADDLYAGLASYLESRLGIAVRIVEARADPGVVRRFDATQGVMTLSEQLPHRTRTFQLAHVIGLVTLGDHLDRIVGDGLVTSDESRPLGRIALANYFAAAVMMP